MRIHIMGISGTFMAGIAILAKQCGHIVTGSDMNIYPPMSTQLESQGIKVMSGYDPLNLDPSVDCVVVGNVIRRGNPMMEYVLANNLPYLSGPEWLAKYILQDRWVLAVSGTHGKTTTTSMLTWALEHAGLVPGFLVGGVPQNFGISARLGEHPYFVIEADEYDSAFFDKRSKFIHYRPKTLIINNLEYDHADIFPDLAAIKQQFHFLVRTVPGNGLIIHHAADANIADMLTHGCWTPAVSFAGSNGQLQAKLLKEDGSHFEVIQEGSVVGQVQWSLLGRHNVENALAVIAAATHAGVPLPTILTGLSLFKNVKRRMEVKGEVGGVTLYDDFAHHPTAIATTLAGLRARIGSQARLIAVVEFGSYTMRSGVHKSQIKESLKLADLILFQRPVMEWGLEALLPEFQQPASIHDDVDSLVSDLSILLNRGDHIIVMSNSGFGGVHDKLLSAMQKKLLS